ncbi:MAG: CHAT domain-containing protein [Candidatus Methanomethyliaceae archaeon]
MGTIEWLRARSAAEELQRAQFFATKTYPFELMASWQAELGDAGGVFSAMERSRARVLVEQMELAGQDLLAGLPEEEAGRLRQKEAEVLSRISSLRRQLEVLAGRQDLTEAQKREEARRLEGELRRAQQEYVVVRGEVRAASPVYRLALQKERKPVGLDKVRSWAEGQKALVLEYLVGWKESYVLVIPAGGSVRVEKLTVSEEQAKLLEVAAGALKEEVLEGILRGPREAAQEETAPGERVRKRAGLWEELSKADRPEASGKLAPKLRALWELLVPEGERRGLLEGRYERLVVVPDRALALLPFEVLVVSRGEPVRYLVDRGPPVLYAPSCTVLLQLEGRQAEGAGQAKEPVLLVGHCRYGVPSEGAGEDVLGQLAARSVYARLGGQLQELPSTAWELDWLKEVYQRGGQEVAWLREEWATERNVRRNVAGRRVVHFATHGLVDQRLGNLFGALALTPGRAAEDPRDDGYLTLGEILGLPLGGCELVVLSACGTNVGPEQRGEGVHGLARGFLVAGARRVAASNWQVADEATANLMTIFATYVAEEQKAGRPVDYAAALHKAKRWMRQHGRPDWREPFYWAPFILIGTP